MSPLPRTEISTLLLFTLLPSVLGLMGIFLMNLMSTPLGKNLINVSLGQSLKKSEVEDALLMGTTLGIIFFGILQHC